MSLNPDDPTIPVGCGDSVETTPQSQYEKSNGSAFMHFLRDGLDLFASNRLKVKVLERELEDVTNEIAAKSQLGVEDFDNIDQLAAASEALEKVDKTLREVEDAVNNAAPLSIKVAFAQSPLIVELEGIQLKVSSNYSSLYNGPSRILIREIIE